MKQFFKVFLIAVIALGGLWIPTDNGQYQRVEAAGETWEYSYTGNIQTWNVPYSGQYEIIVYGASGGNGGDQYKPYAWGGTISGGTGSAGNKNVMNVVLNSGDSYIVVVGGVGGAGGTGTFNEIDGAYRGGAVGGVGGYNGGTNGGSTGPVIRYHGSGGGGGGGGGASEILDLLVASGGNGGNGASGDYTGLGGQGGKPNNGFLQSEISGNGFVKITFLNRTPLLSLTQPTDNLALSEVTGHNSLAILGTVKDEDVGDVLTVKYSLGDIAAHQNKQLGTNIAANNTNQSFGGNISVNNTIPEGTHILKIWAEDDKGGKSNEITRTIIVDKTPPVITYSGIVDTQEYVATTSMNYNATDPRIQSVTASYILNNGNPVPYTSGTILKQYGNYSVTITAVDTVGNQSNKYITFSIKPPAPILELVNVSDQTIKINDTQAYTEDVKWQFVIDGEAFDLVNNSEYIFNNLMPATPYEINIIVEDIANNQVSSDPMTIWTDAALINSITVTNRNIDSVTIAVTDTNPHNNATEYQYIIGAFNSNWTTDKTYTFNNLNPGLHDIAIKVRNSSLNITKPNIEIGTMTYIIATEPAEPLLDIIPSTNKITITLTPDAGYIENIEFNLSLFEIDGITLISQTGLAKEGEGWLTTDWSHTFTELTPNTKYIVRGDARYAEE